MATRTAPTVNGTPTYKRVSMHFMDYNGEKRSDSYKLAAAATVAEIEALAVALQAISNSTLWQIGVADIYNSVEDSSNATEDVYEDADVHVLFQAKNASGDSMRFYVPSPDDAILIDGTLEIDPTNGSIAALLTAITAVLPAGYGVVGARFVQKRDMEQATKF